MMSSIRWSPPSDGLTIKTIEMHTGGEPVRIPVEGLPEIKGDSVLEMRRYFRDHLDFLRTGLMWEPRGHADMYGAVITPPFTSGADFGTFFLHNEGYSTMCGHATIALTKFAVETGLVDKDGPTIDLVIDAPPGRLRATAFCENGRVVRSSFLNVPSFLYLRDRETYVPGIGNIRFDVAYGGAFYAFVEAGPLGLKLEAGDYHRLIDFGRRIKRAVIERYSIRHPFEDDLSFLYGTIFTGPPKDPAHHSRNVCIFADGEVDRSATGSGVSARAALHHAKGELREGETITIESILGTTMTVKVAETTTYGPYPAVVPEVSGRAFFTGTNEFWFDPEDDLKGGFIFR
jgi:proline racemase